MFSFLEPYLERRRIEAEVRNNAAAWHEAEKALRARGASRDEFAASEAEYAQESFDLGDQLEALNSLMLVKKARQLRVQVPSYGDKEAWTRSARLGSYHLTPEAYVALRSVIRKEQNERWQFWELRTKVLITLGTTATGLVGAIIGWIALVK
jgi:hypothetical protein